MFQETLISLATFSVVTSQSCLLFLWHEHALFYVNFSSLFIEKQEITFFYTTKLFLYLLQLNVLILILAFSLVSGRVSAEKIVIDGKEIEWNDIKIIISDRYDSAKEDPADIKYIKAVTDGGFLYLMIKTTGKAAAGLEINYAFLVDTNGDYKEDFQSAFNKEMAWMWDLRSYSNSQDAYKNMEKNYKVLKNVEISWGGCG